MEFADGVLQVLPCAYRAADTTKTALAVSLAALWLGRVPTVYYLAFVADVGAIGIWIEIALGNIVGAIGAGGGSPGGRGSGRWWTPGGSRTSRP